MNYLKISFIGLLVNLSFSLTGQIPAIAGGLGFSSGVTMNRLSTGNPAIYGKGYFKINDKFKIVAGLSTFSTKKRSYPSEEATLRNYMFQGDLDIHYSIYKDHPLRFIGIAGLNTTYILSRWKLDEDLGQDVENKSGFNLGLNIGGGINMFVDNDFDAFVSGKFIVSKYNQFVINVGIIYYFEGLRRKGGW